MAPVAIAHALDSCPRPPWPMYSDLLAQLANESGDFLVIWLPTYERTGVPT